MNPKVTIQELLARTPKRHKFGVDQTEQGKQNRTYKGILYHSRAEALYAQQLDILQMTGHIRIWKRQVKYPLQINGIHCGDYVADFQVFKGHTPPEVVDVKGHQTAESRLKIALMKAIYGIEVVIVQVGGRKRTACSFQSPKKSKSKK